MSARWMIAVSALALAACASPPAAERAPPPPVATQQPVAPAPAPAGGPVAAPNVSVPTPQPAPADDRGGDITVPGQVEQQVRPPRGDPRTAAQRMEDIRNWDTCVMEVQGRAEGDPTRPQLDQPEDYCSQALGQASRTAVPARRLEQRR